MVDVAVIGAGAWGKNHIRIFSGLPHVRLKYICDSDPAKRTTVGKAYPQSTAIENIQPILRDPDVKGVVVASSAVSHHALAKELLMADKDVLWKSRWP